MTAPEHDPLVASPAPRAGEAVRLAVAPLPAHVRTVRLVVAAAARRAGVPEDLVEEVRAAVGEAASRAVTGTSAAGSAEPVEVEVVREEDGLVVRVLDRVGTAGAEAVPDAAADADADALAALAAAPDAGGEEPALPPALGLALLRGLVDDVRVEPRDGGGSVVALRWPLPAA